MKSLTLSGLALLIAVSAEARTNVQGNMDQLKENVENSAANRDQYKKNMDISTQNVVEATKAVKELREQRTQLLKNGQNIDKNKAALNEVKVQIEGFKTEEEQSLKAEEAQIAQVKALLQRLEENKRQRENNIQAYNAKIEEIEAEKAGWDQQRQSMAEIKQEIDTKEKEAMGERAKWLEKKNSYRTEALKWNGQNKVAEQTYTKYKRLND